MILLRDYISEVPVVKHPRLHISSAVFLTRKALLIQVERMAPSIFGIPKISSAKS